MCVYIIIVKCFRIYQRTALERVASTFGSPTAYQVEIISYSGENLTFERLLLFSTVNA